ncbi:hypothetical protein C8R43DRAFT_1125821 [Mycena crocata]|nr:hypothetical protein C8R43DRAFT_1125821 [Mycena crocata]
MSLRRIYRVETAALYKDQSRCQGLLFPTGDIAPRFVRITQSLHKRPFDRPHIAPWLLEGIPRSLPSRVYHVYYPEQEAIHHFGHHWVHPVNKFLNVRADTFILPSWHGNLVAMKWNVHEQEYVDMEPDDLYSCATAVLSYALIYLKYGALTGS